MRICGFSWSGSSPPLRHVYLPVSEFTGILGPNDTGKSQILRHLAEALSFTDAPDDHSRAPAGVFFAHCSEEEFASIAAHALFDLTTEDSNSLVGGTQPAERDTWSAGPWTGLDRVRLSADLDPVSGWRSALVSTLDDKGQAGAWDLVLAAATAVDQHHEGDGVLLALEPDVAEPTREKVWNLFACVPPFDGLAHELKDALSVIGIRPEDKEPELLPSLLGRSLGAHLGAVRVDHRGLRAAPVLVAPLGRSGLPLAPLGFDLPTSFDIIRERLEAIVGVVAARMRQINDASAQESLTYPPTPDEAWVRAGPGTAEVDPDASAACDAVTATANELLPAFISERYELMLALRPPNEWGRKGRLELCLAQECKPDESDLVERSRGSRDPGDGTLPVHHAAAGYHVWLQLALLEAASALSSFGVLLDHQLDELETAFERNNQVDWETATDENVERAEEELSVAQQNAERTMELFRSGEPIPRETARGLVDLSMVVGPSRSPAARALTALQRPWLYVLDEPERHLHPRLQRQAARWLADAVRARGSQAVIATHSVPFMGVGEGATYTYLTRVGAGLTAPAAIDPGTLTQMDVATKELGLDRGELMALKNVILWVEGRHDQRVLEALFPSELHEYGILVVPMHSTGKRRSVLDAEVVVRFTAALLAVWFDNVVPEFLARLREEPKYADVARTDRALPSECRQLADLTVTAREHGKLVQCLGHSRKDIFDLLDEEAIRQEYPESHYPGHAEADARWEAELKAGRRAGQRKAWIQEQFGVPVTAESCERIATRMRDIDRRPSELVAVIAECERLALEAP